MTYTYVETPDKHGAYIASGEIASDEQERFILATSGRPTSLVFLQSDGGYLIGGIKLGDYVRAQGYTVIVPQGTCASACFLIYAAARHKGWERGALIGVHRARDREYGETVISLAVTQMMTQKLNEWGVPPQIAGKLDYTAPGDITWLTENDLLSLGANAAITLPRYVSFAPPMRPSFQTAAATPAGSANDLDTTSAAAGLADRQRYEAWFATLTGDTRDGAAFWAAHRSERPHAPPCVGSSDFIAGCSAAQATLTPMDKRRLSDPAYRQGFNSYVANQEAYRDGLSDRTSWEDWFAGLIGPEREGALWWAGERSKQDAETCEAHEAVVSDPGTWLDGCEDARRRLAPADKRRHSEPDYRSGWNSYRSAPAQTAEAGTVVPSFSGDGQSTPPPAAPEPPSQPPAVPQPTPQPPPAPQPPPQPPTARRAECKDVSGLGTVCLSFPETDVKLNLGAPTRTNEGTCDEGTPDARTCEVWHYLRSCRDYRVIFESSDTGSMGVVSVKAAADPSCPPQ